MIYGKCRLMFVMVVSTIMICILGSTSVWAASADWYDGDGYFKNIRVDSSLKAGEGFSANATITDAFKSVKPSFNVYYKITQQNANFDTISTTGEKRLGDYRSGDTVKSGKVTLDKDTRYVYIAFIDKSRVRNDGKFRTDCWRFKVAASSSNSSSNNSNSSSNSSSSNSSAKKTPIVKMDKDSYYLRVEDSSSSQKVYSDKSKNVTLTSDQKIVSAGIWHNTKVKDSWEYSINGKRIAGGEVSLPTSDGKYGVYTPSLSLKDYGGKTLTIKFKCLSHSNDSVSYSYKIKAASSSSMDKDSYYLRVEDSSGSQNVYNDKSKNVTLTSDQKIVSAGIWHNAQVKDSWEYSISGKRIAGGEVSLPTSDGKYGVYTPSLSLKDYGGKTFTVKFKCLSHSNDSVSYSYKIKAASSLPSGQIIPGEAVLSFKKTSLTMVAGDSTSNYLSLNHKSVTKSSELTSDNPKVASIDKNGRITAISEGKATIKGKYQNYEAVCTVTVKPLAVKELSFSKDSLTLLAGSTKSISLKAVTDNGSKTVTKISQLTSDNPKVASIDKNGKVTALSEGTATITASYSGKTAKCTVTVSPIKDIKELYFSRKAFKVYPQKTYSIKLKAKYDGKKTADITKIANFESSNKDVAVIDQENGKLVTKNPGQAIITGTYEGKSVQLTVEVK